MKIPILHEDNHLLVVQKPVNIPVQEDRTKDRDLLSILKKDLKTRFQKPGNVFLALVHRLDRPVGGVMVFAKTSKAASRLSDAIRRSAFDKEYFAVVHGKPARNEKVLEHHLAKNRRENIVYPVTSGHPKAKKAKLAYEMIGHKHGLTMLSIRLYTGRPHQIRVQLADFGYPLYGDQKYGEKVNQPGQQIALWAHSLTFEHPTQKEPITVKSPPPDQFPWNLWEI